MKLRIADLDALKRRIMVNLLHGELMGILGREMRIPIRKAKKRRCVEAIFFCLDHCCDREMAEFFWKECAQLSPLAVWVDGDVLCSTVRLRPYKLPQVNGGGSALPERHRTMSMTYLEPFDPSLWSGIGANELKHSITRFNKQFRHEGMKSDRHFKFAHLVSSDELMEEVHSMAQVMYGQLRMMQ